VATPRDSALRSLIQSGLIVPDDLDPDNEYVPLDFTQPASPAIGALHSRFAVRHAHALFVQARVATELSRKRAELRKREVLFRANRSDDYAQKWKLDAAMARDERISELRDEVGELEIQLELFKAVTLGYEDFVKAASREMTRRESERAPRD
jgi:hypothetical protein